METINKFGLIRVNARQAIFAFVYIIFLMNFCINGYEFGTPVETVRISGLMLLLISLIQKRDRNKIVFIQGFLLIVTAVISIVRSDIITLSGSRIWNYIFCVVVFACVSSAYIEPKYFEVILKYYINFAFLLSVVVIIGYFIGFGVDNSGRASINFGDFFKDQNYLSAYFMPACSIKMYEILIEKKRSAMYIVFPISFLFAILIMGSRGSFLTAIAIAFFLILRLFLFEKNLVRKISSILLLLFGTAIVLMLFYDSPLFQRMTNFETYGSDVRLRLWAAGLSGFRNNIILGCGVGSASSYSWSMVGNAVHNCFIEILSDHGLIGAILILWIFLRLLLVKTKNKHLGIVFCISLFLPLFFLSGYSNMTFWMPMFLLQNFLTYLENKSGRSV